jgi:hypothetical protein
VDEDGTSRGDDLLADVNAHAFDLAQRLGWDEDDLWGFRCECGARGCEEKVLLPLPRYAEIRRRHEPVLAPGHCVTSPP